MYEVIVKNICDVCGGKLELVEDITTNVIFGNTIKYNKKRLICKKCCKETYDKDIFNENVARTNDELRKITGLIRNEEIKEITEKYKVGNKSLSLILGFGEIQIDRYLKSGNPSKEHSDLLKSIYNNPLVFEMYLFNNKDKITDNVYKKSLSAVKQIELVNDKSKIYSIVQYMLLKCDDLTNMSIQKILYFINGFSKYFLGHRLFNDNCEAWIYGPVYRDIYDALCVFYREFIDKKDLIKPDVIELTAEEKRYLDDILPFFENYSGHALKNMTHITEPWEKTRKGLGDKEISNRIIDYIDIDNYFENVIKKYNIKKINDVKKYSEELFNNAVENSI